MLPPGKGAKTHFIGVQHAKLMSRLRFRWLMSQRDRINIDARVVKCKGYVIDKYRQIKACVLYKLVEHIYIYYIYISRNKYIDRYEVDYISQGQKMLRRNL